MGLVISWEVRFVPPAPSIVVLFRSPLDSPQTSAFDTWRCRSALSVALLWAPAWAVALAAAGIGWGNFPLSVIQPWLDAGYQYMETIALLLPPPSQQRELDLATLIKDLQKLIALSPEERKAAETLGWDIKAWDDKYEESNFGDLPPHVAKAATAIGFTAEMWDGNRWPGFEHKYWKELSEKEQIALNVLGWTEWKWDHSP